MMDSSGKAGAGLFKYSIVPLKAGVAVHLGIHWEPGTDLLRRIPLPLFIESSVYEFRREVPEQKVRKSGNFPGKEPGRHLETESLEEVPEAL